MPANIAMMASFRVFLFLVTLASAVAAVSSNFTSSCSNFVLHKGAAGHLDKLTASCFGEDATRSVHNSTLDLNLCLGIDYVTANLVWSIYGKFTNYCKSCYVAGRTKLGCSCSTLNGIKSNSTIDLDDGIANSNGTLSCQGGIGM